MKANAQRLKALAAYKLLKARARVSVESVVASEVKLAALAKAAVMLASTTGDALVAATKCSALLADAMGGHYFSAFDLVDIMAALDSYEIEFGKVSQDEAQTIDSTTSTLYKVLTDTVTTSELFARQFSVAHSDSAGTADIMTPTRVPEGGLLAPDELNSAHDVATVAAGKVFLEQLTATDDLDATTTTQDDQVMAFNKFKNELLQTHELIAAHIEKLKADSVAAGDDGYLFWTNYCDASYFTQGYVGQQTAFT